MKKLEPFDNVRTCIIMYIISYSLKMKLLQTFRPYLTLVVREFAE